MNAWNIIFLLDKIPLTKIVLLKRAPTKKFAPNLYTGIGGKVEANETILESAYRELEEETGITEVKLEPFAKVVIDQKEELHYFYGIFPKTPTINTPPIISSPLRRGQGEVDTNLPNSPDGTLEWTNTEDILQKPIIPTTLEMLKQWQSQNFSLQPFTLYVETISEENGIKKVKIIPIIDKNQQKV